MPASVTGGGPQVEVALFEEPLQARPGAHDCTPPPGQQSCPMAPQARQVAMLHRWPAAQVLSSQQGWPGPPHRAQVPGLPIPRPPQPRRVPQSPSPPVPQQGCPAPPQVPHLLPVALTTQPIPDWQAMPLLQQA